MTALLDTTILIDHLRGSEAAERLLLSLFGRRERVWAAVPTRSEIIGGIRDTERARMNDLFSVVSWVDIDAQIADAAGELAREFRLTHPGVDTVDYLIAAAAQTIGAQLLTLNVKHFPMFAGLSAPY